ncbi:MAG: sensor histidine kinase [Rhodothermaceae bacterium]|nr:sensor histidine kinase [Rhodothermaceae bacterium]MXZ17217.1 sensor histidine kinase [Rhodothermaceae bacterium]MXZ57782.1 sensor histidine kinase [Rhodothermaceae bacterium]MYB91706.1 sensor histidine kinase [Rhodothermaceae bacterium]MYD67580.1 sensor histidine kinase [Rhodothermaceae bacterium]
MKNDTVNQDAELKVGAHVLVQLGSELVTDVEQAILECVKNAYDADAPGCLIEIDTLEIDTLEENGPASKLVRFNDRAEAVEVEIVNDQGTRVSLDDVVGENEDVTRRLTYTGRITIEDKGEGLRLDQLYNSWLVISQSAKRGEPGKKKAKTKKGRTPLGDKGLGRLGSMKLGDILRIETSTSPSEPLAVARFRWADCHTARTVDEIPVLVERIPNPEKFKGTRVSVLGLQDLSEWRRKGRVGEIARSLARLISPFEATSTFPVGIKLDGDDHSLVSVTEEALKRAIAEFKFDWQTDPENLDKQVLVVQARFRKRLFTSTRTRKDKERTALVFNQDGGTEFAKALESHGRLKAYQDKQIDLEGQWFVELKRTYQWRDMQSDSGTEIADPGPFSGAFYFFHLDKLGDDADEPATAGLSIDPKLIKEMSGISILRDGFRVRSQGDWLDLSLTMTSGSTYGMRVNNTIGYFALSVEHNHGLIEKSDREGFIENPAYRGFLQIAQQCRDYANESLEQIRRALDDYYKKLIDSQDPTMPPTARGSFRVLESEFKSAEKMREKTERIVQNLQADVKHLEREAAVSDAGNVSADRALKVANKAVTTIEAIQSKLSSGAQASANLVRLRREFDEHDEQRVALFESAAVGLSARGLAHELRTHLTEIRQRTSAIERAIKRKNGDILPFLRAIRSSCSAISSAASLIDPMLPRSRAIKESISLRIFMKDYFKNRAFVFKRTGIQTLITGIGITVRMNRPRLTQIIDNLVRNSIYWLQRGELIGKSTRAKQITVELTRSGFIVSDTGPGVDPFYEETLFEIFVTAKPDRDGQGLGLYIVTELLRIDGGEIDLLPERNEDGQRYRFDVNLGPLVVSDQ